MPGGARNWVRALLSLSKVIDAINVQIGRWCAWAILLAVAVSAINAVVRKAFDMSSNAWLELQWVLFSVVFLLCASWTLRDNEHIRIDIVNNLLPRWLRNTIELIGHAFFLLPLAIVLVVTGVPFFIKSYELNEQSGNAGGLAQWPTKSLVMIAFALLLAQGISELIKRVAVMRDLIPDPHAAQPSALEAEAEHLIEAMGIEKK
jgi:TRAP-type mannitol/chloroaromatic compound transport system permease small subunit